MKTKVILPVNEEGQDVSGVISEKVWCEEVEKNIYRILNIPFYAFGYSFNDEVYAPNLDVPIGFKDIINFSEQSTILVLVMNEIHQKLYIKFAEDWGCGYESSVSRKSLAISIPLNIDLQAMVLELGAITDENNDGFIISTQRHYSNNDVFTAK